MKPKTIFYAIIIPIFAALCIESLPLTACASSTPPLAQASPSPTGQEKMKPMKATTALLTSTLYLPVVTRTPGLTPGGFLVQPTDLDYVGAFRLPGDAPDEIGWLWSGEALTYYPDGDPTGPDDGFPGSLFGTGHNWNQYVSEVSIPVPVISPGKNLDELNTATTLQPFQDIRGDLFDWPLEQPRAGLEYLPPQGDQDSGKLYFCWAPHLDEGASNPSHGWAGLDLANPQPAGLWRIGEYWNYVTTDYIFAIPQAWADTYTPGMGLATGRYRDGGQGSMGPSLLATGPWNEGNPPQPNGTLSVIPLLLYGNISQEGASAMEGYAHSDHWTGGAWLTTGDRAAVIFAGTKGLGKTWYGCPDGTVWPEEPPYPPECPDRGWWSEQFAAQIIFYNPADLAAVVTGTMDSGDPQPYATLEIEEVLYNPDFVLLNHLGATAFDRERGLLYILEPLADEERSLVHVWQID